MSGDFFAERGYVSNDEYAAPLDPDSDAVHQRIHDQGPNPLQVVPVRVHDVLHDFPPMLPVPRPGDEDIAVEAAIVLPAVEGEGPEVNVLLDGLPMSNTEHNLIRMYRNRHREHEEKANETSVTKSGRKRKRYTSSVRKRKHTVGQLVTSSMQTIIKAYTLLTACCLGDLQIVSFIHARDNYKTLNSAQRDTFITAGIQKHLHDDEGLVTYGGDHICCRKCWWTYHGFSHNKFYTTRNRIVSGDADRFDYVDRRAGRFTVHPHVNVYRMDTEVHR